mmetsp:Transcript_31208/g.61590  ORF Transcript_31208/g.61590 Transcript_31208/m.61590 type:complete len:156 (-) Transcript_31208:422-889(-)
MIRKKEKEALRLHAWVGGSMRMMKDLERMPACMQERNSVDRSIDRSEKKEEELWPPMHRMTVHSADRLTACTSNSGMSRRSFDRSSRSFVMVCTDLTNDDPRLHQAWKRIPSFYLPRSSFMCEIVYVRVVSAQCFPSFLSVDPTVLACVPAMQQV